MIALGSEGVVMLNQVMEQSLSKLMTKILRHTPEDFGVLLDPEDSSCPLDSLLEAHSSTA